MADGSMRVPPNDLDAEAAVLSACFADLSKEALDEARAVLGADDFYSDANRRIWEGIVELDAEGKPIDVVVIAERLRSRGRLGQIGGTPYLAQIADATPAIAHVAEHARIIADKARQRRMLRFCHDTLAEGYGNVPDARTWLLDKAQVVSDLASDGTEQDPTESLDELVPRVVEELAARARSDAPFSGVDTGWRRYTEFLGGWERGKSHVIAGRPGMGKSAFALGGCINVAKRGEPTLMFSAEMRKEELVQRALAMEANVSVSAVRSGRMHAEEWAAVTAAATRLRSIPLSLKYVPGAKIAEIRSAFRREQRKRGRLALGAVDYLQVLNGERGANDSRENEVAGLSKRLMWMAAEFDIPLLVLSQLNRAVEARSNKNKRPSLADLRESGAIEQDAYTVTLLYRDDYYDKDSEFAGTLDAIVAKHRSGPTGTVRLAFRADSTLIANLHEDEQEGFQY